MMLYPASIKVEQDYVKVEVDMSATPIFKDEPLVIKQEPVFIKQEFGPPIPIEVIPKEEKPVNSETSVPKPPKSSGSSSVAPPTRTTQYSNKIVPTGNRQNKSKAQRNRYVPYSYSQYNTSAYYNNTYNGGSNHYNRRNNRYSSSYQQNMEWNYSSNYSYADTRHPYNRYGWSTLYSNYNDPNPGNTWSYKQQNLSHYDESCYVNSPQNLQSRFANDCTLARQELLALPPPPRPPAVEDEIIDLSEYLPKSILMWKQNSLFKIGIWDKVYMTQECLVKLKRIIIAEIMLDDNQTTVPRIYDCILQKGWLQISCKDPESRDWIRNVCRGLKPWPRANLRTRDCDEVENYVTTTIMVHRSDASSTRELIRLLKKQNYGLTVNQWRIDKVYYQGEFLNVDFILTEGQLAELRRIDYKLSVGLGQAMVLVKN